MNSNCRQFYLLPPISTSSTIFPDFSLFKSVVVYFALPSEKSIHVVRILFQLHSVHRQIYTTTTNTHTEQKKDMANKEHHLLLCFVDFSKLHLSFNDSKAGIKGQPKIYSKERRRKTFNHFKLDNQQMSNIEQSINRF